MFMRWLSLLFLHWPIEASQLRPLIPESLAIDEYDGTAWIGLVPFTMRDVRHRLSCGRVGIASTIHFHECNVRTYVTIDSEPGVWFFSLDAASRLAVWGARRFWNLPYFHSRISLEKNSHVGCIRYEVARPVRRGNVQENSSSPGLFCEWQPGDALPPSQPGSIEHFLTERYCLYSSNRTGQVMRGRIAHKPWPLREAKVLQFQDSLIAALGLHVDIDLQNNPPLAWHSDGVDADAWRLIAVDA